MQPDSSTMEQLSELPVAAMEALLESDQLKVMSENTVLAAVTYWLEQEGRREALTAEQLQGLAFKLRLCSCTRWYLTAHLMDTKGWLYAALKHEQRTMLLASVTRPEEFEHFTFNHPPSCEKLVFSGCADGSKDVRWWKEHRSKSMAGSFSFQVKPQEIWAEDGSLPLGQVFTNGLVVRLAAAFQVEEEEGVDECSGFEFCIDFTHCHQHAPVVYSAETSLQAPQTDDTVIRQMDVYECRPVATWFPANLCRSVESLPDAIAALRTLIHPDGNLHIKVRITVK